ncbi:unnamed protein product [Brassica oleracea var. botrytis]
MNAWLPQASYPCGNFSDTSSFKFRRSKGSIGHAFTVRIRTENQNQTSFYPFVPHEISVLVELILGHLHPPKRVLGLKEGVVTPLPIHGVSKITQGQWESLGFPLSVPVLSWLFDARGKLPKEPFPVRPLADTWQSAPATLAAQAARQQSTGSELGPPSPALRTNPFPEVTDPFCRLPLPTLFHRPEAVHLGDLMRL